MTATEILITVITGIISSILGAVIVKYFKPLSTWLVNILSKISKKYRNSLYRDIAKENQNKASIFVASFMVMALVGLAEVFIIMAHSRINGLRNETTEKLNSYENIDKPTPEISQAEFRVKNKKILSDILIDLERTKIQLVFWTIFVIIGVIIVFVTFARIQYIINLNALFKQHLKRIRPAIKEELYLSIKQDWAFMQSKEDYLRIEKILDNKLEEVLEIRKAKN